MTTEPDRSLSLARGTDAPPAAQRVLERLREMIVSGEIGQGARIIERTLCAKLNVSRTPMREALKLLEIGGLIELSQHRGARVRAFTEQEAVDLFEVLSGLESLAAELATSRITPQGIYELKRLHTVMSTHYKTGDLDAYFDTNTRIHEVVVEFSGNRALQDTHPGLMLRAKRGRYMAILDTQRWHQAMDEHAALLDAIGRRNAADAGHVWRAHLVHTGRTVEAVLHDAERVRAVS